MNQLQANLEIAVNAFQNNEDLAALAISSVQTDTGLSAITTHVQGRGHRLYRVLKLAMHRDELLAELVQAAVDEYREDINHSV